jgi:hypothetical protein
MNSLYSPTERLKSRCWLGRSTGDVLPAKHMAGKEE